MERSQGLENEAQVCMSLEDYIKAWYNLSYIVCFGSYCLHEFVSDDANLFLSLMF
jgi:hypothetical protein